ncbi:MAG: glycosyltransferase family 9 protein [Bacteroidetes bacterium]|nr:glycosyltransferase family 9 protein [Bacteroidota bacterium]
MSRSATKSMLVIRFSSMGDVAMTVPVLKNLLLQHPSLRVIMVSKQTFAPLFDNIDGLEFFGVDLKGRHRGLTGAWKLFKELSEKTGATLVADLHNVLRTKLLVFLFKLNGAAVATVDKGRKEKRALTRQKHKVIKPLTTTFDRYASVFHSLGFTLRLEPVIFSKKSIEKDRLQIGFAPFAKHAGKSLPASLAKQFIEALVEAIPCQLFLFGAPGEEAAVLSSWEREFPNTSNRAGQLALSQELQLIANMDLMITMDSANMHLSSLVGTPVISIWGATHPFAGFLGWGQSIDQVIQTDLTCRPCSVFGNKPCFRGDYACLHQLLPQQMVQQVRAYLCEK